MALSLVTPPSEEPIALAAAKAQMRVEINEDDDFIGRLIAAARQHVEGVTGRALVTQTWDLVLDDFPDVLRLPLGKVQSISQILYSDADGAPQALTSDNYVADFASTPARIVPVNAWPATRGSIASVAVRFVAGYGAASAVPADLCHAMLLLVSHWYENRELVYASNIILSPVPFAFDALVAKYVLY